jgi:hypothetical protein
MKKFLLALGFIGLLTFDFFGQTSITQGFETAGVGLSFTVNGSGGSVNTEHQRTGLRSLRLGRGAPGSGNPGCPGPLDGNEVVFAPITLIGSSCPGTFQFYHRTNIIGSGLCTSGEGMDTREGFAVYRRLNGSLTWVLITAFSAFNDADWTWSSGTISFVGFGGTLGNQCGSPIFPNPFVYNTPAGTTSAQFKIITIFGTGSGCGDFPTSLASATGSNYNRGDEGFYIDDVSFVTVGPCTLPISVRNFYAQPQTSSTDLYWNIATETNVNYYLIEKSTNGDIWQEVAKVKSMSSSAGRYNLNYQAIDKAPQPGINYYRLTNVDNDGSQQQHKIIMVNFSAQNNTNVWINQNETDIIISHTDDYKYKQFYLMDMQGRVINNFENPSHNLNYFTIDKSTLAKGLYVIGCTDAAMPPQKLLIN